MKKLLIIALMCAAIPAFAETTTETVVVEEATVEVTPAQQVENTKSYTGVNYNRQDSKKTGKQKITNDHSWFNVNINIIKEGALFQKDN